MIEIPDLWSGNDEKIGREFTFDDFAESMVFVNQVAELAEAHEHHPDLHICFDTVVVELTTHDDGGVTKKDVELANDINNLETTST